MAGASPLHPGGPAKVNADITVCVPTLNSAATLEWTLVSLLGQRQVRAEVVVADSASSDGTLDICQRHGVRVLYAEPGNMYRAVNVGLRASQTEWLTYVNSDDWLYPSALARLIQLGRKTAADVVYGDLDRVDGEGRFLFLDRGAPLRCLYGVFAGGPLPFGQPAAIFRRDWYERLGGFAEEFRCAADLDFFLRAYLGKAKFVRLGRPSVAAFRVHASQISLRQFALARQEERAILQRHGLSLARPGSWPGWYGWRLSRCLQYAVRLSRRRELRGDSL